MSTAKEWSTQCAIDYYFNNLHEVSDLYPSATIFLPRVRFPVAQVLDLDGTLAPEIQGVSIGSYLRFREMHVFSCHNN